MSILHVFHKEQEEHFGEDLGGRVRRLLWDLLEYPETSKPAQFISVLSIAIVCLSTITLMVAAGQYLILLTTLMQVEAVLENDLEFMTDQLKLNISRDNLNLRIEWDLEGEKRMLLRGLQAFDSLAVAFFTIEFIIRLLLSPIKTKFLKNRMNMVSFVKSCLLCQVDLIALIPYYLSNILAGLQDLEIIGKLCYSSSI